MKKIHIALGLIETATEAQAVVAINNMKSNSESLQKNNTELATQVKDLETKNDSLSLSIKGVTEANEQFAKNAEEHANVIAKMNESHAEEMKTLKKELEEKSTLAEALQEKVNQADAFIKELNQQLNEANPENDSVDTSDIGNMDELKAKANELMSADLTVIYMTTDGTPFYTKDDANRHAFDKGLKVVKFGA